MTKLKYKVGDIIEVEEENVAYLQRHQKGKTWDITVSKKGTPFNLIGGINPNLIEERVITDITKYNKINEKDYIKLYGYVVNPEN